MSERKMTNKWQEMIVTWNTIQTISIKKWSVKKVFVVVVLFSGTRKFFCRRSYVLLVVLKLFTDTKKVCRGTSAFMLNVELWIFHWAWRNFRETIFTKCIWRHILGCPVTHQRAGGNCLRNTGVYLCLKLGVCGRLKRWNHFLREVKSVLKSTNRK